LTVDFARKSSSQAATESVKFNEFGKIADVFRYSGP
jgi:hypothetical protein